MPESVQRFDPRQHMSRPSFEIFHYHDTHPGHVDMHHHDFYEVYFLLAGRVEYRVEGKMYRLDPGDVLLINPMELHQPLVAPEQAYERIVLWVDKTYLDLVCGENAELSRCFDSTLPTHTNVLRPSPARRHELLALLQQLVQEDRSTDYASALCARGLLLQFLVMLNRLALRSAARQNSREENEPLIAAVLSYIGEHYSEELSLDTLASRFYVSKYHLSHEFSRVVGVSLHRYLLLKRLQLARQMLSDGLSPGLVCSRCGFGDYANFYRAFKKRYGVAPKDCAL